MTVTLVMAREPIPTGPSLFLAGPSGGGESWRPDAIEAITTAWTGPETLTILSPESRGGIRARSYETHVNWEIDARAAADVILFWIPRDMVLKPGMTTNVEYGFDLASTRTLVLGCPPDCPSPERNRYLIHLAHRFGAPVRETLADTVATALELVARNHRPAVTPSR